MKKLLHILWMPLTLAFTLSSCSWEEAVLPVDPGIQTRALTVTLKDNGEEGKQETVNTVRLIVFDDASTGHPSLDINETYSVKEANKTATGFEVTAKVKVGGDKMVVAVVNEPTALKTELDGVRIFSDLESILYKFENILNANHTGFLAGQYMPMTGAKRGITVTESNTSQNPATTSMTVERAFARVDVYLKAASGVTATLSTATRISLLGTYDKGYLAVGTKVDGTREQTGPAAVNNFGRLLTVGASSLLDHNLPEGQAPEYATWSPTGSVTLTEANGTQLVSSFYIAERTCTGTPEDKLKLRFENILVGSTLKGLTHTLESMTPEGGGTAQDLEIIKRNNVYKITATIKNSEVTFDHFVVPWVPVGMGIIIDPQYFLRVDQDNIYLPANRTPVTITAETDYNRDDRGFPAGIYLGETQYYDKYDNLLSFPGDFLTHWMQVPVVGPEGKLSLALTFYTLNVQDYYIGCYALVEIKAGNLSKIIRVNYVHPVA